MARTFLNKTKIPLNQGFIPDLEVKLFGQWDETIKVLQKVSPTVKEAGIRAQMKVCKDLMKAVKAHILNQDLGWAPLSSAYEQKKSDAGMSGGILYARGTYYRSIKVWTKGSQHMVFVGVPTGIYTQGLNGKRSKIEVAQIAAIHEFSSGRKIPRRPLWNPTIAEMGGAKGLKDAFVKSFVAHLRVRGIPIKQYNRLSL